MEVSLITNVSLTPELEQVINNKVESGMYHSASEVVREGLRLLVEQDAIKELRLQELRKQIAQGFEQIEQGHYTEYAPRGSSRTTSKRKAASALRHTESRRSHEETAHFRGSRAELADIWLYLFDKDERAADRLVEEAANLYERLCDFPGMGVRRSLPGSEYRSIPLRIYVI